MKASISQYKLLFCLSWASLYLIFPSWALPISVTARFIIFAGLIIYFAALAYLMNLWLNALFVDKPVFIFTNNWLREIKSNLLLSIVCCLAIILHAYPISMPIDIDYDEPAHLQGALGMYIYIKSYWVKLFDFPIQYVSWALTGLLVVIVKLKTINNYILNKLSKYWLNNRVKLFCIFLLFCFLVAYFLFLRNLPYHPALFRFPPIGKIFYLASYASLGINQYGPRILQLIFYVLSAIYLFRTIKLYRNKDTALLGATIYLFSPLPFLYAHRAELASGTIFLLVLISYYFLRFIKYKENRDLIITAFFIGFGFLYKRSVLLMFFICVAYVIFNITKNKNLQLKINLKVLLLSLVPIIPWLIIGKFSSMRNYEFTWAHIISFDRLVSYFLFIPSQVSWLIFFLFLFSIIFALVNIKDDISLYFGFLFIAYYFFYTADVSFLDYSSKKHYKRIDYLYRDI